MVLIYFANDYTQKIRKSQVKISIFNMDIFTVCPLTWIRTKDHSLKRRVLYQLSYEWNSLKNNKCYFLCPRRGSVTSIFLLKNLATQPRVRHAPAFDPSSDLNKNPCGRLCHKKVNSINLPFVPKTGVEPVSLARHDFKSCAYTNSATRANILS